MDNVEFTYEYRSMDNNSCIILNLPTDIDL